MRPVCSRAVRMHTGPRQQCSVRLHGSRVKCEGHWWLCDRLRTSTMAVSLHGNARQCLVVHTLLAHAQSTALPLPHLHRDYARPAKHSHRTGLPSKRLLAFIPSSLAADCGSTMRTRTRTNASCWRSCAHAADYLRPPSEPVVTSVAPAMFGACPVAASANDDDRLRRRFVAAAN